MNSKKNVFAIIGSASKQSSNLIIVKKFIEMSDEFFNVTVFNELSSLPHFNPELSIEHTPEVILHLRNSITQADIVLISTPEYVFSIPSGLKNAIEWCLSTTVFSNKSFGIITASANGLKGHEELQLIMKTVDAKFNEENCLLIQGVKGKIDNNGNIIDEKTNEDLYHFAKGLSSM